MTVTYIYLRHAPKEHKNGQAPIGNPQHDPSILKESIGKCQSIGKILTDNYHKPDIVIISPYRRTIQTAEALMSKTGVYISKKQIFVDSNIAEYLGNQKGRIDLTPETYKYSSQLENLAPLRTGESLEEFKERIMDHIEMLQILPTEDTYSGDRVVWIITHGFVISTIYDILKSNNFLTSKEETFYPDELEGIVVRMDGEDRRVSTIKITDKEDGSTSIKIPFVTKK